MSVDARISVVLPAYNSERFISEAVTSIATQTYSNFELIIIDDGSTDSTRELAQGFAKEDHRIKVLAEPHRGLIAALNRGIEVSGGEYIARMDADDISLPERFARQIAFLDSHPDACAVGSGIRKINENGKVLRAKPGRTKQFSLDTFPIKLPAIPHPTAVIRSAVLKRIGGYRPYFPRAEDRDLWYRLALHGRITCLEEPLLDYRVHASSVTQSGQAPNQVADLFLTYLLVDLSAIAGHHGLDDSAILTASLRQSRTISVRAYIDLIGERYPAEAYCMYFLMIHHLWAVAGLQSRRDLILYVWDLIRRRPFGQPQTQKMIQAAIGTLLRGPRASAAGNYESLTSTAG